ncbi:MAG: hypothetical protein JST75_09280 [Bacteroidetes bacterium]|nr:hypothetical protein [Bacteroidota bacterium]
MFYDTIEKIFVHKGEKIRLKICPLLYANFDCHEFTGNYALYVNDEEYQIGKSKKGNWYVADQEKLNYEIVLFAGKEIEEYIYNNPDKL